MKDFEITLNSNTQMKNYRRNGKSHCVVKIHKENSKMKTLVFLKECIKEAKDLLVTRLKNSVWKLLQKVVMLQSCNAAKRILLILANIDIFRYFISGTGVPK